jgi:hypothetical protein
MVAQRIFEVKRTRRCTRGCQSMQDYLRTLARHTLGMEETKFKVGQAPAAEVIGAQRDLATAEDDEVKARAIPGILNGISSK